MDVHVLFQLTITRINHSRWRIKAFLKEEYIQTHIYVTYNKMLS